MRRSAFLGMARHTTGLQRVRQEQTQELARPEEAAEKGDAAPNRPIPAALPAWSG